MATSNKNKINLIALSDDEIRDLINKSYDEINRRKKIREEHLIKTFIETFNKLKEEGIYIKYGCDCCGEEYLVNLNDFYFD